MFLQLLYINHIPFPFCLFFNYKSSIKHSRMPFNAGGCEAWSYYSIFLVASMSLLCAIRFISDEGYLRELYTFFCHFKLTLLCLKTISAVFDICS